VSHLSIFLITNLPSIENLIDTQAVSIEFSQKSLITVTELKYLIVLSCFPEFFLIIKPYAEFHLNTKRSQKNFFIVCGCANINNCVARTYSSVG
jgi:positive regulator of sigma E activity